MSVPRTSTREHILKRATMLFQGRGYNGFSFKDISAPMGIRNAAIHYHFPTKSDLCSAVIARYRDLLKSETGDFMKHGGSAKSQLDAYLAFIRHEILDAHCMCPLTNVAVALDTLPGEVRAQATMLSHDLLAYLTRVMELGREQGEFQFNCAAEQKALSVKAALQGAGQLARLMGPQVVDQVIDQIRCDLGL
ncbi:MAG: TetR/AcrR family transcriptional regulator [Proteobacteria bacterium]|nr:TetR/AcrR family transcriptional regulator [Pseudomonadota bacterium]MCH8219983.1 TetR/AcrR family transcriptional regulator [Pseudomonadota bacterium]MCH8930260.1 TetR/AcrR family transcriptional regulator [Pseudomonadota bacterium]